MIEEALEDDSDQGFLEKMDEKGEVATSPPHHAMVGTSFDEKSGSLHGYHANVPEINPSDDRTTDEDGQGLS